MQAARVVGHTTATFKHPSMQGSKLLLVQPYMTDGVTPDGDVQIAVDHMGAGMGETVLINNDGAGTAELLKSETSPVRWIVAGIIDS